MLFRSLSATIYSKSALRVAAHETTMRHAGVRYFPSYEIVTGPQAPREFFEANRRDVSDAGIQAVMEAFFAGCEMAGANAMPVDVFAPVQIAAAQSSTSALASDLIKAECEEAYADRR